MSKILEWGPMSIEVSPERIVPLHKLSTGYARKAETNEDTSGTPATNTRGMELQEIHFETSYIAAAGVNPRDALVQWRSLFGQEHYLYIGGQVLGAGPMALDKVDVSDIKLSPTGQFMQLDLAITLMESSAQDVPPPAAKTSSGGSSGSREQASAAKPSTAQKQQHKPDPPKRSKNKSNPDTGKPSSIQDRSTRPVMLEK